MCVSLECESKTHKNLINEKHKAIQKETPINKILKRKRVKEKEDKYNKKLRDDESISKILFEEANNSSVKTLDNNNVSEDNNIHSHQTKF